MRDQLLELMVHRDNRNPDLRRQILKNDPGLIERRTNVRNNLNSAQLNLY